MASETLTATVTVDELEEADEALLVQRERAFHTRDLNIRNKRASGGLAYAPGLTVTT